MSIDDVIFKWESWITAREIYVQDLNNGHNFKRMEQLQTEADLVKLVLSDLRQAKPHYEETIH